MQGFRKVHDLPESAVGDVGNITIMPTVHFLDNFPAKGPGTVPGVGGVVGRIADVVVLLGKCEATNAALVEIDTTLRRSPSMGAPFSMPRERSAP